MQPSDKYWDSIALGAKSDRVIAAETGHSKYQVERARMYRGLPSSGRAKSTKQRPKPEPRFRYDWSKEPLGKEPDSVIADRLGCARSVVHNARARRGIKAFVPAEIDWVAMGIGVKPDGEVGALTGRTKQTIRKLRKRLGIAPARAAHARYSIDWSAIDLHAKKTNAELAEELGCKRGAISYHRCKAGIKPQSPQVDWERAMELCQSYSDAVVAALLETTTRKVAARRVKAIGRRQRRKPVDLARLGKEFDYVLAAEHGVAESTIWRRRQELGIPPMRAQP
jgi:hypothetical protein